MKELNLNVKSRRKLFNVIFVSKTFSLPKGEVGFFPKHRRVWFSSQFSEQFLTLDWEIKFVVPNAKQEP